MNNNRNYGRDSKTHHFKMPSFDKHDRTVSTREGLFEKHKQILSHYPSNQLPKQAQQSEASILQSNHVFIRDDQESDTWESRLAKKYYDKLFKEYGLANLDFYKQNRIALRWRTEQEVFSGKGQFACGNLKCRATESLSTWEVPFSYTEHDEKKLALVKLKLCQECAYKLNYKSEKEKRKRKISDGHDDSAREDKALKADDLVKEQADAAKEDVLWTAPVKKQTEKEEDEDFDAYLNDIFS